MAVEVSVTTPANWERENVRKCLDAGILARCAGPWPNREWNPSEVIARPSRKVFTRSTEPRLSILSPEDLPDLITSLALPPEPSESIVKGNRVRGSQRRRGVAKRGPRGEKPWRASLPNR